MKEFAATDAKDVNINYMFDAPFDADQRRIKKNRIGARERKRDGGGGERSGEREKQREGGETER